MPISWKTQFESPLVNLIHLNQIENSDQLVNKIAQFYDLSIKTGAPMAPGTPAGPVITGHIQGFKSTLKLYYKLQKLSTTKIEVAKYVTRIKKIVELGKEIKSEIDNITTELHSAKADKLTLLSSVMNIANSKEFDIIFNSIPEGGLKETLRKLVIKEHELKQKLVAVKNKLKKVVYDKVEILKKEIADFIAKLRPGGSEGSIKKRKFKAITDSKKIIRQSILSSQVIKREISDTKSQIEVFSNSISEISGNDISTYNLIARLLLQIVAASYTKTLEIITTILVIVEGYPISDASKSKVRNSLIKIAEFKKRIETKEEEIATKFKSKIKSKLNQITKELLPSKNLKTNRIKEKIEDSKKIKRIIHRLDVIRKDVVLIANFIKVIATIKREIELKQFKAAVHSTVLLSEAALSFISKNDPDLYSKLSNNNTIQAIKSFIHDKEQALNGELMRLKRTEKKLLSFKDKLVQSLKDKLVNRQSIIFGQFVKIALLRYWTGATCVNLGVVTFPGTAITTPLRMVQSEGPAELISQLSKVFQLHLKTVSGTYTTPAGVFTPWVGYF